MYNILVLDNGRQALPFIKNYRKKKYRVIVISDTIFCETFLSRYPSERHIWPSITSKDYLDTLINYIKKNRIDFILCVGDKTTEIVSKNKSKISQYSNTIQPNYDTYSKVTNKLLLMEFCMDNKIPCPISYPLNNITIDNNFYNLNFPVITKPLSGIGAIGVKKYVSKKELILDYELLYNKYGDMLVQEYIPQKNEIQYQAEVFLDFNSRVKACVILEKPRYFPVKGGTSTANYSINNNEIKKNVTYLLEKLKWIGAADVDIVLDDRDKTYKILEINPRVTAGIKTAFMSGVDFSTLHLNMALGKDIIAQNEYKTNIYCRNIILELLWFIFTTNSSRKKHFKSFFDFFGKNKYEQTFEFSDPLPLLGFALNIVFKYFNIKKLREKFHI